LPKAQKTGFNRQVTTVGEHPVDLVTVINPKAGKKIGVEWRTLIRPAKEILEIGNVQKKDTNYYPAS